ncbi:hypothetical protein [Streptomyces rhizosphaericus]|uniref:Uncharacterized protein n=1 Tax=Streptomyces rhizosphaericus TaxID=114699 RepID=A0A6G4AJ92_9ACTN|nr:hypothetical protein [Streptomyces rhizosphaericus]NEW72567.1 hypothetical protein [Streptomyces rhizosphaericus]
MTAELQRAPVSLPSVASILAAMGLDWLGYPPIPVPHAHRRALCRFRWPELIPAAAN